MRASAHALVGLAITGAVLVSSTPAHAQQAPAPIGKSDAASPAPSTTPRMMVLPSLYLVRTTGGVSARAPRPTDGVTARRLDELTSTLRDAGAELGYEVDLLPMDPPWPEDDADLIEYAATDHVTYVVSALEAHGNGYRLRVAMATPGRSELRVRYADVGAADVPAKGLVLMRALLRQAARDDAAPRPAQEPAAATKATTNPSEQRFGRAVLAANAGVLGALTAFSVQRASGSDDPRVLFPLLALGSGAGIAGGLVVADEFELDTNQALFLASGAWWGVGAGLLVANGRQIEPFSDRYLWGIGGGALGTVLASAWSTRRKMDSGALVLENSGAVFGATLGGLAEAFAQGTTRDAPRTGGGIGAMAGLALAAGTAAFVRVPTGRVLLVDLGAAIGGLGAAAIASPLVFEHAEGGRARGFFAATAGGLVVGGAVTYFLTRRERAPKLAWLETVTPTLGVIGASATREGSVPAWGIGFGGRL